MLPEKFSIYCQSSRSSCWNDVSKTSVDVFLERRCFFLVSLFVSETAEYAENFGARRKQPTACLLEFCQSVHELHLVRGVVPFTRCRIHLPVLRIGSCRHRFFRQTLEFFDRCNFLFLEGDQRFRCNFFSWSAASGLRRECVLLRRFIS